MKIVRVIGAGLAGCEACYQLLKRNYFVELYEVKYLKKNPIQHNDLFANLAYSDSFRSNLLTDSVGTLKQEMRMLDSLIIKAAEFSSTESNNSLVLNRIKFQEYITNFLQSQKNLKIIKQEYVEIDLNIPTIIATGPITTTSLENSIRNLVGENNFYLFDAVEPMVWKQSINMDLVYQQKDDLYCLLNKEQFENIYNQIINAEIFISPLPGEIKMVEDYGLKSLESIARNKELLLKTIFKPIKNSYASVRLKKDSVKDNIYTIVGFQTSIKWPFQKNIIKSIPALENAEILRYGVMHKNDYINSKELVNVGFQLKNHPNIFFAGQITGVDGYVESVASAIISSINLDRYLNNKKLIIPSVDSTIGALCNYLHKTTDQIFQPIKINWAIVGKNTKIPTSLIDKQKLSNKAIKSIQKYISKINKNY
ncbi:methylenetetrahydrofolate--tRNA-(uracil(54)-C(5))-methyltransferase (FADH(2)-oxidizing) TrmFO [Mycoplasma yeatsii]|uniref:methylenetetrahydrofolate--tRNA-(uracil(54)- C(5))-methyltransferase (FADH(2)-oxidizing) TrmFO n=1 Tax=Mycoplasma yeatsii TaxID=51365 RepID=UPI0005B2460B|nr:methylenetetrahydrofolate--tRNA-(uracil(54)-C(5))-methyltransferase (FADH(2)-oxidizing) TrmFO [Mycoplasma yeatsii]AJM71909.1 methylenetetrahydrofolate--tRNA-(uracil-5-)- methyltransferase [Mycoplasma yeatsii GM274B]